ncbi:hypothetical protein [Leptospira mayottensis]|uniref:Lipoprotein n=2 Tax=Leptospira mayottensis TaxID=1137606 RepID=A0AA87MPC9_9LEPT|nr:hypothetical protein [Leptospira mayottensis]AXR60172.1 hypothetical protein DQM68_05080 [Leptospira mayottensis]AXR63578.1 hypothetical protein DQM28_04405 [Leptospira mayottensis]AZQ03407.1 hypothetical protein LEP1GSC190_16670 [Leptospira mayottensis 200901116]EKR99832.1 putative lipoprotein [Leptospira mayottensis 200901122]TGN04078.1 hypothetical protein EHR03_11105 [Leptospira mayottensis]
MTRKNILKFAWTLFLFGFGCATNYNDFDRRIYIVEGLKKQNIQEEKIPEKRKPNGLSQLQLVTIQEEIGIPNLLLEKTKFSDVELKFGNQYIKNYLYLNPGEKGIRYESLGISLIFRDYEDILLREISMEFPFQAVTSKGIILGKNTLQEATVVYGGGIMWEIKEDSYWCIRYNFKNYDDGIRFCAKKDPSIFPEYDPANKTFYLKQKIQRIDLF